MIKLLLICHLLLAQTINIDTARSVIFWKGTKMNGTGYHEGTLKLRSGTLILTNGNLTGGTFQIDMNSLQVTDIPAHETIPLFNLTKHLKDEFETTTYPVAKVVITQIAGTSATANLTIMNTTGRVTFPINKTASGYQTILKISRKAWHIGHNASWLENRLVDDAIELRVQLVTR